MIMNQISIWCVSFEGVKPKQRDDYVDFLNNNNNNKQAQQLKTFDLLSREKQCKFYFLCRYGNTSICNTG